jgi:hypothetical protein
LKIFNLCSIIISIFAFKLINIIIFIADLDGLKEQLEKTLGSESIQRQLSRQKSSDTASLTGSLSKSVEGSELRLRRRTSEKESSTSPSAGGQSEKKVGQKLIEVEKSETGSVSF